MVLRPTLALGNRRSIDAPSSMPLQLESIQPRASETSSIPSWSTSGPRHATLHTGLSPQVERCTLEQLLPPVQMSLVQLLGSESAQLDSAQHTLPTQLPLWHSVPALQVPPLG